MKETNAKRIAIAADGAQVSPHFGRCRAYVIADLDRATGAVANRWELPNPGHAPEVLPHLLAQHQVDVIIAGGMGPRAQGLFQDRGIEAVIGPSGTVDTLLQNFAGGTLQLGDSACEHVTGITPDSHRGEV